MEEDRSSGRSIPGRPERHGAHNDDQCKTSDEVLLELIRLNRQILMQYERIVGVVNAQSVHIQFLSGEILKLTHSDNTADQAKINAIAAKLQKVEDVAEGIEDLEVPVTSPPNPPEVP